MSFCYKCGSEVPADVNFCNNCGAQLKATQNSATPTPVALTAPQDRPPMPESNLVWAILTTLFCCLPFGIVSIVYACKVSGLYIAGYYEEAQKSSRRAGLWAMWAAITGALILTIYLIIVFTAATHSVRHNLFDYM